jgi:4'-phosphopantetheinyl transferase
MPPRNPISNPWQTAHSIHSLPPGELQIWRIDLPVSPTLLATCQSLLNPEEAARAERRRQPQARQLFIASRGVLRQLLAAATGLDPQKLTITAAPGGKPELPGSGIAFNVAHSGNTILIALSHGGQLGVDVEHIDPARPFDEVAQHSCTPAESLELFALNDIDQRRQAFYRLWARKEAIVKADGRGLALPFNSFALPLSPASSTPIHIAQPSGPARTFYVTDLPLEPGLAGAIALETPIDRMKLLIFPPA